MEMEQLEAAIYNWPLAPYDNKLDVDANFKRMVDFGMKPENINAVHLGIGSHNLFELTYAFKLAQKYEVTEYFSFEMLTASQPCTGAEKCGDRFLRKQSGPKIYS